MKKKKGTEVFKRYLAVLLCAVLAGTSGSTSLANGETPVNVQETEDAQEAGKGTEAQESVGTADNCSAEVQLEIGGFNGEMLQNPLSLTMPAKYHTLQEYGFPETEPDPGYYTVMHVLAEYAVQSGMASMGDVWGSGKLDVSNGFLNDWFGYNSSLGLNDASSGVSFMYLVDGVAADVGMASQKITSGMSVTLFDAWWYYSGSIYESGAYAAFSSISADVKAGQAFDVKLHVAGGAADGIQVEVLDENGEPFEGAAATPTDAEGKAGVVIPEAGTYTLTAMKYSGYYAKDGTYGQLITRPYMSVYVAPGRSVTDEEAVEQASEQLSLPDITAEDIVLPVTGSDGVEITWSSGNTELINSTGKVTRPVIKDEKVILTAVLTKGEAAAEKEFEITVEGLPLLKSLSVSPGALVFDKKTDCYTVYVKEDTEKIGVTAKAEEEVYLFKIGIEGSYTGDGTYVYPKSREEQTFEARLHETGTTDITVFVNRQGTEGTTTIHVKKADNPGEPLEELPADWGQHLGGPENNALSEAEGPTDAGKLLWESKGEEDTAYGTAYAGHPLLVNGKLYVVRNRQIQILDAEDGTLIKAAELAGDIGFYSYPAYGEGKIFVPLGDGSVQCFNALTLEALFRTYVPKTGMTGLSSIHYRDGMIYVGYTNGAWSDSDLAGGFAAYETLDLNQGATDELVSPAWIYEGNGSYYGMGAVTVEKAGKIYLIFAGDDGDVICADAKTGEVKSSKNAGGKVRCSIVYADGAVWLTSQDGAVHKYAVGTDGTLAEMSHAKLPATTNASPVVADGKVYVTGGVWQAGYLFVFDTELNVLAEERFTGETYGPLNTPTVTTAYGDVYVYFTQNVSPDRLFAAKVTSDNRITVNVLYTSPTEHANYSMSNVVIGEDGTLYYGNDSGYLIAVRKGTVQPEKEPEKKPEQDPQIKPEAPGKPPVLTSNPKLLQSTAVQTLKPSKRQGKQKSKSQRIADGILAAIEKGESSLTVTNVPELLEAVVFEELAKHDDFLLILDMGTYTISMRGADVKNPSASLVTALKETTVGLTKEEEKALGNYQVLELTNDGVLPGKLTVVRQIPKNLQDAEKIYLYEKTDLKQATDTVISDGYCMFTLERDGIYILSDAEAEHTQASAVKLEETDAVIPADSKGDNEIPSWVWAIAGLGGGVLLGAAAMAVLSRRRRREQSWEE